MKYNKSKIITDKDIILSDFETDLGDTLKKQQDQIDSLKSNVKWMYKYGALGSGAGSGGGGSQQSTFKVLMYKDGVELIHSNDTIYYSNPGTYNITIKILNAGSAQYSVKVSVNGKSANGANGEVVGAAQGFTLQKQLNFQQNGNVTISVVNFDTYEQFDDSFKYIVNAYSFNAYYVKGNDPTTEDELPEPNIYDKSIFINDIKSTGVMLALKYAVAVDIDLTYTKLSYIDFDGNRVSYTGTASRITQGNGILYFKLADDIMDYINDNNNANYKNVEMRVEIKLMNTTIPEPEYVANLNVNLIPYGLYLKVTTNGGQLIQQNEKNQSTIFSTVSALEESKHFNPGDIIFNITPYNGTKNKNRQYTVNFELYDVDENGVVATTPRATNTQPIQPNDQEYKSISVPCGIGGIKKLVFKMTCVDGATSQYVEYAYWMNVKIFESVFNWYPSYRENDELKYLKPVSQAYHRYSLETHGISGMSINTLIEQNINSSIVTYQLDVSDITNTIGFENVNDVFLSLGIQYGKTNDYTKPIMSFNAKGSTETEIAPGSIIVYQDKISVTTGISSIYNNTLELGTVDENIEIFIPLIELLNNTIKSNYHMLSIYKRLENIEQNNYWKGVYAFIDGTLDGAAENFKSSNSIFTSVTFYPANYKINLIETSYWKHDGESDSKTPLPYLMDNDVTGFWYTYNERMRSETGSVTYTDKETALYNLFTGNNFWIDEKNNVQYSDDALPSNIANNIDIPVLVLNYDDINGGGEINAYSSGWNKDNLKTFLEMTNFEENEELPKIPVTVQYSQGSDDEQGLHYITLPNSNEIPNFYISIQGSSTRTFDEKNLELYAPDAQEGSVYVYSPNNDPDPENTEAFLPEQSFTLKADVVDSSHTNNNAIGLFVNANTQRFNDADVVQGNSSYKSRLKNCLTGFPILLFLNSTYHTSATDSTPYTNHYFLGIYNFNLGRGSAFNMGYKYINRLDETLSNSNKGFQIFNISNEQNELLTNIEVAEIQGNNVHFDFSQYDSSVLFPLNKSDKTYMWGDFVHGDIEEGDLKNNIQAFVRDIAKSGGYVFTQIGKLLSDSTTDEYGYAHPYSGYDDDGKALNQVPNFKYQYKRYFEGGLLKTSYTEQNEVISELREKLIDTILNYIDENDDKHDNAVDFRALSEYFVVCMTFALVDNVMKNLNIKSWNAENKKRWYPAFYDMDCGFGKNNAGNKINYFAFSDYWDSKITKNASNENILGEVEIYRDWSPSDINNAGSFFDVPSSYLFAIAKYAYIILQPNDADNSYLASAIRALEQFTPSNIWGKWRKANGCLRDAKYVMENYFAYHLKNVPEYIFNLNYRIKYFVKNNVNNPTGFENGNFSKFHGRSIAYTEYWMDGRLHILDAYFNVMGYDDKLVPTNYDSMRVTSQDCIPSDNPDVYILHDIFCNDSTGLQYNTNTHGPITVTGRPLSPIYIKIANADKRYLLPQQSIPCVINFRTSGLQNVLFGGSALWTDTSTVNPFITDGKGLSIHSNYLTRINGNNYEAIFNTADFNVPAIKTISLTSPNYSGTIELRTSLDKQYNNLTDIDISESKINLYLDDVPIKSIRALNRDGGILSVKNIKTLNNVQISGKFDKLELNSWSENCVLPSGGSFSCRELSVTNFTDRFADASIEISNNNELETLILNGFKSVKVSDCRSLKTISMINCDIEHLSISMPNSNLLTEELLTITDGTGNIQPGTIDLSTFEHINTLKLQNCNINEVVFGDDQTVELESQAFANCDTLNKIITGENTRLYLTGPGTFQNCHSLVYHNYADDGEEGETRVFIPLYVKDGTESLNYTFACSQGTDRGYFELFDLVSFIENIKSDMIEVTVGGHQVMRPQTRAVESIEEMFRNQSITYSVERGLQEYNEGRCSIDMSIFLIPCAMNTVLADNDIRFLNRYMFYNSTTGLRFGQNRKAPYFVFTLRNMGTMYATIDALYEVFGKCQTLDLLNTELAFVNDDGSMINRLKLNDIFKSAYVDYTHEKNILQNISEFNVTQSYSEGNVGKTVVFDFSELFNSPKYDSTTHDIVYDGSDVVYGDDWDTNNKYVLSKFLPGSYHVDAYENVNHLLSHCTLGDKVTASFGGFVSDNPDEVYRALDIYSFIDWDNLSNCRVLFHTETVYTGANAHGISSGLNVKKYVTYRNLQTIIEKILSTSSLEYVGALFNNCTVFTGDVNSEFRFVTNSFNLQNTTLFSIGGLFMNMKLSDSDLNDSEPIIVSHKLMEPFKNVKSFVNTFENWFFKYPLSFDFFNKRQMSINTVGNAKYDTDNNEITNVYKYEYTYNDDIIDVHNCFHNVRFATMSAYKSSGVYDATGFNVNGTIGRSRFEYEYVDDPTRHSSQSIILTTGRTSTVSSHEVTDAEIAEQPGYSIIKTNGLNDLQLDNMYISNVPQDRIDPTGCFIAPDILYGLAPNAFFKTMFSRNEDHYNKNYYTFTGTIPMHMMKSQYEDAHTLYNRTFDGMFDGLNITPIHRAEYDDPNSTFKHYVFVPDNFSGADDFSGAFNFNMLLPRQNTEFFTLLTENSLPNMTRLVEAFYTSRFDCQNNANLLSGSDELSPVHLRDYNIRWNIMCCHDANDVTVYGIDVNRYPRMRYDGILNSIQMYIYYGDLMITNEPWNKNKLYNSGSCVYAVSSLSPDFRNVMNISKNIRLTATASNDNFFALNNSIRVNVNKVSLVNCNDTTEWTSEGKPYYPSFNIVTESSAASVETGG